MIYRIVALILLVHVSHAQNKKDLSVNLNSLGSFSSPRDSDLNNDGIKDIIIGAGGLEFMQSDSAILALDGRDGKMLWKAPANEQIFGSAALVDLTDDGDS